MTDERIIAYLLKELPAGEAERFEDECFALDDWPAQIDAVEDDLIEDYLRRALTPERRRRFEQNYLTTVARQERVLLAAALLRRIDESDASAQTGIAARPPKQTWSERFHALRNAQGWRLRAALACALIIVVAGAWWLARPRVPSPQTFATISLSVSRGNRAEGVAAATVKLPFDALKVTLTLPEGAAAATRYRVELEDESGEKKRTEIIAQDAQSVTLSIPAAQLARGRYALKLFAVKADGTEQPFSGSYFFNVE